METKMFCYQCQETAGNKGCTINGVCGKTNVTSNLQDLLVFVSKALSEVLRTARKEGIKVSKEINHLIFHIGETLVSESKQEMKSEDVCEKIRELLKNYQFALDRIENGDEIENV